MLTFEPVFSIAIAVTNYFAGKKHDGQLTNQLVYLLLSNN